MTIVRIAGATLRVAPWPADPRTAQLTLLPGDLPPTAAVVHGALAEAAASGFRAAVTGALGEAERGPFLDAGLAPQAWLHLLERSLEALPVPPERSTLRRIRRSEWPVVAAVDASAFAPFWRLGIEGIVDARRATPSNRMRVATAAGDDTIVGYAVFGRSAGRGFVQRIAVDPAVHGRGIGTALLLDGLRWLADRGALSALVNTQVGNDRALQLYRRTGFRLLHEQLAVLGRSLDNRM